MTTASAKVSVKSMTGYGRGEAQRRGLRCVVELSSVNRKQLDIRFALPKSLAVLESRVVAEIQGCVSRGHVVGGADIDLGSAMKRRTVSIDNDLASAYVGALRKAARVLRIPGEISVTDVLHLPDVVRRDSGYKDPEEVWPLVARALKDALSQLLATRAAEGAAIARDLRQRLDALVKIHARIARAAPGVVKDYRRQLSERLAAAGAPADASNATLLRELVVFTDRTDVTEELTRMQSHFRMGFELLASTKPAGRALDFLLQEFFREINTLSAKASNAAIARDVILFKTELERIREQAQNLE